MRVQPIISILTVVFIMAACENTGKIHTANMDTDVENQIDSLLGMMTLEEKIGQMNQYSGGYDVTGPVFNRETDLEDIKKGMVGSMLNIVGAEETRKMQQLAVEESRLGIPMLFALDVIHGHKTIFPIPLAEASSWDMEVAHTSARVAAVEASAQGIHWTFAPMVDIARDPRWGRIMEGAGEDPYLGQLMAAARVYGFQGNDLSEINTIMACAKHYAAYGGAEGGRDYNTVDMSERVLRNVYLPPFKTALDAGVGTFMNAFNEIGGIPATADAYLVQDILKDEWNFNGFVVSDWNSIGELIAHGVAKDKKEAAALAVKAGSDMDMESTAYRDELKNLVEEGEVDESLIDDAVRRILRMKIQLGLLEDPYRYCNEQREEELLLSKEHLEAARDVARRSIVLLKNENQVLPVSREASTVAVIGPLADSKRDLIGNWSAKGEAKHSISLREGIENALPEANVLYAKGCEVTGDSKSGFAQAIAIADKSDVVILAIGESWDMSGEAKSRGSLEIPGVQVDLARELHETGKPVVVVLMNGRPLSFPWLKENVPAIVEAWFLGTQAGNAIADVLFGDYNPSGKLPVTFPYSVGQIPMYYNHKNTGRPFDENSGYTSKYIDIPNEPLYAFGYGLSYTTFEYDNMVLSSGAVSSDEKLTISVEVTNTGEREGEEVVQLYIRDLAASITRPVKELKRFRKINLQPGASEEVSFELSAEDLKFYDTNLNYIAEPGEFKVFVGGNSVDVLEKQFTLK